MSIAFEYVLQRNVGTVGRPPKACAVCNFSPSGHLLVARLGMELLPEHDKGLCNVHAQGLASQAVLTDNALEQLERRWRASH